MSDLVETAKKMLGQDPELDIGIKYIIEMDEKQKSLQREYNSLYSQGWRPYPPDASPQKKRSMEWNAVFSLMEGKNIYDQWLPKLWRWEGSENT
jgi:hypothetical protein